MPQLLRPASPLRIVSRGYRKPVRPQLIRNHPLNRGIVGCWLLGDVGPKGITADLTGVNPGTLVNGPTLAPSHHGGLALNFASASSQYLTIGGTVFTPGHGNWAAAIWVNPTTTGSMCFFAQDVASNAAFWIIVNADTAGTNHAGYWNAGLMNAVRSQFLLTGVNSDVVPRGAWTRLLFQRTSTTTIEIYRNGILDASSSGTDVNVPALNAVNIGRRALSGFNFYVSGAAEGGKIWNRTLSKSEIILDYAEPYAGITDFRPDWRVGAGAAATFNPGWAYNATRTLGAGSVFQ